jgi:hypothetical protein
MASGNVTVRVRMEARPLRAYLRLIRFLVPIIGVPRALRWASLGRKLVLMQVNGRWARLR